VRIVGGYSEGSGFFITDNQVLTNFHVIDGEPSPKVILPDGSFITPTKTIGNKEADLAILYITGSYPDLVLPFAKNFNLQDEEPLLSTGYPLGTDLNGPATVIRGNFIERRKNSNSPVPYIQSSMTVIAGMSGGPLTDTCGNVVGVNTLGIAGLSMFISGEWVEYLIPNFTDQDVQKIDVDPSKSPEASVYAFYTYLKARRMEDGFNLLSSEYVKNTSFEEWTNRFRDILDVDIFTSKKYLYTNDTAFVKFSTKNWVNEEVEYHFYEGTWVTVFEDGVYKMNEADIVEVYNPGYEWFL
jgi:hypothetical protein